MLDKVKTHVLRHKTAYLVGGIAVAGITWYIMRGRHAILQSGMDGSSRITVRPLILFSNRSSQLVTTLHDGTRGHPGFVVKNLETGASFATQGEAARAFGISPSVLSSHLNEKFSNVNGLHFERVAA